jgi:hypothetical protein
LPLLPPLGLPLDPFDPPLGFVPLDDEPVLSPPLLEPLHATSASETKATAKRDPTLEETFERMTLLH